MQRRSSKNIQNLHWQTPCEKNSQLEYSFTHVFVYQKSQTIQHIQLRYLFNVITVKQYKNTPPRYTTEVSKGSTDGQEAVEELPDAAAAAGLVYNKTSLDWYNHALHRNVMQLHRVAVQNHRQLTAE